MRAATSSPLTGIGGRAEINCCEYDWSTVNAHEEWLTERIYKCLYDSGTARKRRCALSTQGRSDNHRPLSDKNRHDPGDFFSSGTRDSVSAFSTVSMIPCSRFNNDLSLIALRSFRKLSLNATFTIFPQESYRRRCG